MKAGVEAAGVSPEKITVIPNLCDPERFQVPASEGEKFRSKYPWLGDRPMVLYAGTLGLVNGVDYLVRVAADMLKRDPEVRFVIMGHGREEQALHGLAERLGVRDRNLFFLPSVPKADIPAVLSAATLATSLFTDVPGMQDNSANKFFDALAASRPWRSTMAAGRRSCSSGSGSACTCPPRTPPPRASCWRAGCVTPSGSPRRERGRDGSAGRTSPRTPRPTGSPRCSSAVASA
ncbi:glycosyltransferase [Cystobacter fuscus]